MQDKDVRIRYLNVTHIKVRNEGGKKKRMKEI
jgi:hypothetical protein